MIFIDFWWQHCNTVSLTTTSVFQSVQKESMQVIHQQTQRNTTSINIQNNCVLLPARWWRKEVWCPFLFCWLCSKTKHCFSYAEVFSSSHWWWWMAVTSKPLLYFCLKFLSGILLCSGFPLNSEGIRKTKHNAGNTFFLNNNCLHFTGCHFTSVESLAKSLHGVCPFIHFNKLNIVAIV